jgi:hypothetical protein
MNLDNKGPFLLAIIFAISHPSSETRYQSPTKSNMECHIKSCNDKNTLSVCSSAAFGQAHTP